MERYFASHIYEEDTNGIPMELLVMSPEDKWNDKVRWTTAASVAGAKKNIRAKLRTVLGYDWKQVQAVDMVFGPVKKETFFGIYSENKGSIKPKEQASIKESAIEKEEKIMKKNGSFATIVTLEHDGRNITVPRRVTFSVQHNGFIIGSVYKDVKTNKNAENIYDQMAAMQSVRVGTWYWDPNSEFPLPHFKPAIGMNPGIKNCIRYAKAIKAGLKEEDGITSSVQFDTQHGASFIDSSASIAEYNAAHKKTVTGTAKPVPAPEINNTLPDAASFFEEAV